MRILEKKLDSDLSCSVTPVTLADLSSHMRLVRHVDSADIEHGSWQKFLLDGTAFKGSLEDGWVGRWTDRSTPRPWCLLCAGNHLSIAHVLVLEPSPRPTDTETGPLGGQLQGPFISICQPFPWSDSGFLLILAPIACVFKEYWSLSFAKKVTNSTTRGWPRRC